MNSCRGIEQKVHYIPSAWKLRWQGKRRWSEHLKCHGWNGTKDRPFSSQGGQRIIKILHKRDWCHCLCLDHHTVNIDNRCTDVRKLEQKLRRNCRKCLTRVISNLWKFSWWNWWCICLMWRRKMTYVWYTKDKSQVWMKLYGPHSLRSLGLTL